MPEPEQAEVPGQCLHTRGALQVASLQPREPGIGVILPSCRIILNLLIRPAIEPR